MVVQTGILQVKRPQAGDRGGYLLSIGSDVLDWACSGKSGDSSETLDAAQSLVANNAHEAVPVEAGRRFDIGSVFRPCDVSSECHVEDKAGEAFVGDEEVGAAAEGEDGERMFAGEVDGFEELVFGGDAGEVAGGASYAECGVGG